MNNTLITLTLTAAVMGTASAANLVVNGDFETGDFTGWTTSQAGGSTLDVRSGTSQAGDTPTGDFYAFAGDQFGPSTNILVQTITLPGAIGSATLSLDFGYNNQSGSFINALPDLVDHTGPANQNFRIDVLSAGAAIDSTGSGNVLFEIFRTNPGDPNPRSFSAFSQDISVDLAAFAGQDVQLRFAQTDNQSPFHVGFDNVVLDVNGGTTVVPEPSSVLSLGFLLGAGFLRRRR